MQLLSVIRCGLHDFVKGLSIKFPLPTYPVFAEIIKFIVPIKVVGDGFAGRIIDNFADGIQALDHARGGGAAFLQKLTG